MGKNLVLDKFWADLDAETIISIKKHTNQWVQFFLTIFKKSDFLRTAFFKNRLIFRPIF